MVLVQVKMSKSSYLKSNFRLEAAVFLAAFCKLFVNLHWSGKLELKKKKPKQKRQTKPVTP